MSDTDRPGDEEETIDTLRARAASLERRLLEAESAAAAQLRHAEIKAEAIRAGIVDLDGLRLLESSVLAGKQGSMTDAAEVVASLRLAKPWLFAAANSSTPASTPAKVPQKRRLATDMTLEEWRTARADLLRRR